MKFKIRKQVRVIKETDEAVFESKVNECLIQHDHSEMKMDFSGGWFYAIIEYQEEIYVPESKEEELELKLEELGFTCESCSHFEESTDKRRKWHHCGKHDKPVMKTTKACVTLGKEAGIEISDFKEKDEGKRPEHPGTRRTCRNINERTLRQDERKDGFQAIREGIHSSNPWIPGGRTVQGGLRCSTRSF